MATGSSYPSSLDSWTNKASGDFLTVADVNARTSAIEQVEIRLNQIFGGKSGGQQIIGGTGPGQNLNLFGTSNASTGNIVFGTTALFSEPITCWGIGTVNPTRTLHLANQNGAATMLAQTDVSPTGPTIELLHNGVFPNIANINFITVAGSPWVAAGITANLLDGNVSSMDSEIVFNVQNNANSTGFNTQGKISSLGVWTDASAAASKEYEGDLEGSVIDKLKALTTLGVYHGKNVPAEKREAAERHYSPTAEEFFEIFGLGKRDSGGIAAKDVGWIAARALLELEARVAQLENRNA